MVLAGYSAFFGTEAQAKSIPSKALTSAKIYINPGHGCYCSECRGMGTVKHGATNSADTSGFYESNTNLWKGFGMRDKLIEYGVPYNKSLAPNSLSQPNLVMSRIKCGSGEDRALSVIAAECETWGADVMISIHSNAATEGTTTNYPVFLYRGYTGSNQNGGSQAIAQKCWGYIWENTHQMWTYYSATNMNIQGDWTFMSSWGTQGYGILRHSVPGFLAEGYFHTYQPARHRAMNRDAGRIEGFAYAKGFRDYFGGGKAVSTGDIYGVLRDGENTFTHTYYKPNTNTDDKYKPINNATVQLKKTDGTVVQTYRTDDEWNGVFVFKSVAPGTYNIVCSHSDYADVTTSVTVTADKVVYPSVKMTQGEQIPVQGHYAYDLSMTKSGDDYTLKFKSTGAVDKGYVILTNTSTATKQSIEIGKIVKGENTKTINANDIGENSTFTWGIALNNPKSSGVQLIKEDNSVTYTHSSGNMARIGLAMDKDPESANFGKFYTLTAFSQGLQKFNQDFSRDGAKECTGMFGEDADNGGGTSSNRYIRPNRIKVNDGKIYIANFGYKNPGVWVYNLNNKSTSEIIGGGYLEFAAAFKGTGSARKMYVMRGSYLRYYNIGASDTWSAGTSSPSGEISTTLLGNGDGDLIMTSKGVFASQWRTSGNNTSDCPVVAFYNNSGTVTFNGSTLSGMSSGTVRGGMAITDDLSTFAIVDGSGNVVVYSVTWNGETPSFASLYSFALSGTTWVDQMEFDPAGNLLVASKEKGLQVYAIKMPTRQTVTPAKASLTIQGKAAPAVKGHYAYGLTMSQSGDNYTVKFNSTGAVDKAYIKFTNKSTGKTKTKAIGAVVEGENTATFSAYDLEETAEFTWSIVLANPASPSNELVHQDNSITYTHTENGVSYPARIGVAINHNPENDKFGRIFTITSFGQGIQEFNQKYEKLGSRALTGLYGIDADGSTSTNRFVRSSRLAISDNKIYIANYAGKTPGIHIYNSHNGGYAQILNAQYERAVGFSGSGANRKMYVYNENGLRRYDVGAADSWSANTGSPSASFTVNMINADGDIIVTDKGVLMSQHRYRGNNTSDVPVFKFMDNSGNIVFNSSSLTDLTGSEVGGMALSADLSTFAIVDGFLEGASADIELKVFDVVWMGSTPSFSFKYSIPLVGTKHVDQMAFDYAGNIVVASQQKGLLVYATKNPAREVTTPAKASLVVNGKAVPAAAGNFAYGLNMTQSGNDYTLMFKSTGAVENANIVFTNKANGNTKKYAVEGVVEGENSFTINAYDLEEEADFTWAVEFENPANPTTELIHKDNSIVYNDGSNNARIGVAIDKDAESPNFGAIYTITGKGQGIQAFNPEYGKVGSLVAANMFGIENNSYVRSSRLEVNNNKIYIANYASTNSGIYVYNVATGECNNIINEKWERAVAISGTGANRVMYALNEDTDLSYYNIGEGDTWAGNSTNPSGNVSLSMSNCDGDIIATEKGIFVSQHRYIGNNTSAEPVFVVVDKASGNVTFNSSTLSSTLTGSQIGGIAISDDLSTFVAVDGYNEDGAADVELDVYNVTWNGNTPSFTHKFSIPLAGTKQVDQMEFDYAGNLVVASRQQGLLVYAIKCDARTTTTAAVASQVVEGKFVHGTEGHFAYDLEMIDNGDSYILNFKSTGDVESAKIVFEETEGVAKSASVEMELGAISEGENSVEVFTEELPFGTQSWAVVLENSASEGAELMKVDNSVAYKSEHDDTQGGVTVDKDTESANFGKIYTVTAYAKGLQAFDAEMNPVGDRLFAGTPFGDSWYSPYRVKANSGKLYITDWIDGRSGVYVYDPNAETPSVSNLFVGTRTEEGKGIIANEENVTVGCNVSSVEFVGEGENRKMFAFAEDPVNEAPANSLLRYDLGTADAWTVAPSAVFSSMSSLLSTADVVLLATDGGLFCAQKSEASNTAEKPAFVYSDFEGNVIFNSSELTDLNGSKSAAIAMFGNIFAIANADANIEVYKVAWNGNVPSFSDKYTIKLNNTKEITQMDFDIAGNLYAFSVQEGLLKFAVKNEGRATRTDAKSTQQLVNSILTAIETVGNDASAVKYYNLQGVEVENPSNGVFIKLQGDKASKVVL